MLEPIVEAEPTNGLISGGVRMESLRGEMERLSGTDDSEPASHRRRHLNAFLWGYAKKSESRRQVEELRFIQVVVRTTNNESPRVVKNVASSFDFERVGVEQVVFDHGVPLAFKLSFCEVLTVRRECSCPVGHRPRARANPSIWASLS